MLIYGAFVPQSRSLVLAVVGASKLAFVLLIVFLGRTYMNGQLGIAVAIDLVWVIVFGIYLLSTRSTKAVTPQS